MKTKNKDGFTFIEILVTITLIAVLTSIGVVSYSRAQRKSRDGKRKADLEAMRSALEMYRADNGIYPTTGNLSDVVDTYMQSLPSVLANTNNCSGSSITDYESVYTSDSSTYSFCLEMEAEENYTVQNP